MIPKGAAKNFETLQRAFDNGNVGGGMREVKLSIAIQVTDNANEVEVRKAVEQCVAEALYLYAQCAKPRESRWCGRTFTFGYAVKAVEVAA